MSNKLIKLQQNLMQILGGVKGRCKDEKLESSLDRLIEGIRGLQPVTARNQSRLQTIEQQLSTCINGIAQDILKGGHRFGILYDEAQRLMANRIDCGLDVCQPSSEEEQVYNILRTFNDKNRFDDATVKDIQLRLSVLIDDIRGRYEQAGTARNSLYVDQEITALSNTILSDNIYDIDYAITSLSEAIAQTRTRAASRKEKNARNIIDEANRLLNRSITEKTNSLAQREGIIHQSKTYIDRLERDLIRENSLGNTHALAHLLARINNKKTELNNHFNIKSVLTSQIDALRYTLTCQNDIRQILTSNASNLSEIAQLFNTKRLSEAIKNNEINQFNSMLFELISKIINEQNESTEARRELPQVSLARHLATNIDDCLSDEDTQQLNEILERHRAQEALNEIIDNPDEESV